MKIPIKGKVQAINNPPDYILVLAWNFFEDIKKNNEDLINAGCKFITLKELSS
jgi:ribosomal protein L18E